MNDVLPEEAGLWQLVETTARRVFALYGYDEIRTPIVESTALFVRGIGEETDIVGKEMYTFQDRGGDSLTLRPEGTAGAVRAYVEHNRHAIDPIQKWFYVGPMFRGERPAKGRYRQFHQVGAELFGVADPRADVELIALVARLLRELGITGTVLRLNSLGDSDSRPAYREAIVKHFAPHAAKLSETDQRRLEKNPLRLLDSKEPGAVELSKTAPSTLDYLSPASTAHFEAVKAGLTAAGVPYEIDPRIVRGLDYYTRTTFEFVATEGLGAQSTVAAGGRYDALVEDLGGPPTPGIGFGLGVERVTLLLESRKAEGRRVPDLFLGVMGDAPTLVAWRLVEACRSLGVSVEMTLKPTAVGKQLGRASRQGARYAAIIGDSEVQSGAVRVKRLQDAHEEVVPTDDLPATLRRWLDGH
jgi:histidyl-tRNA synthetase